MMKLIAFFLLIIFPYILYGEETYDLLGDYNPYLFRSVKPIDFPAADYSKNLKNIIEKKCGRVSSFSHSSGVVHCGVSYYDVYTGKEIDFVSLGNEFLKLKAEREARDKREVKYKSDNDLLSEMLGRYYGEPQILEPLLIRSASVKSEMDTLDRNKTQTGISLLKIEPGTNTSLNRSVSDKLNEAYNMCKPSKLSAWSAGIATCEDGRSINYQNDKLTWVGPVLSSNVAVQSKDIVPGIIQDTSGTSIQSSAPREELQAPKNNWFPDPRDSFLVSPVESGTGLKRFTISAGSGSLSTPSAVTSDGDVAQTPQNTTTEETLNQVQVGVVTPLPELDAKPLELNCQDEIKKKAFELLKADKSNLIGRHFQLTALKLASRIYSSSDRADQSSIEDFIKKSQSNLLKEDKDNILEKMKTFYRLEGKADDQNVINKNFEKMKNASYWNKSSRLYNQEISSFILAEIYSNKGNTAFTELDAAVTWLAGEVNSKMGERGSVQNNLTNISTLVHRQLEYLRGSQKRYQAFMTKYAQLEQELLIDQGKMKDVLQKQYNACQAQNQSSPCWSQEIYNTSFIDAVLKVAQELKTSDSQNYHLDLSKNGGFKINFVPPSP